MLANDTIAALSTPPGEGAIAVVRVSGPDALIIAGKVFRGPVPKPRTAVFGRIFDENEIIDEGILTAFHGPSSYTGEDVVEISCHGGMVISSRVLRAVLNAGARAANPGEFTQRAFLNGKMDLTQAEAVMDLIRAQTPLAARAAAEQLRGRIGNEVQRIRENLLDIVAHMEAYIDFPDEDIDPDTGVILRERMNAVRTQLTKLLDTADEGRILREGVRLVICGRPNAGKSSLLNRLLGYQRAIVSSTPGTTRDTLEEMLNLNGIPFRVIDTAGLRDAADSIEREGIRRAHEAMENADIVLRIIDRTDAEALHDPETTNDEIIAVNKCDLVSHFEIPLEFRQKMISISCLTGDGMSNLVKTIVNRVRMDSTMRQDSFAAINTRHQTCLQRAAIALGAAIEQFDRNAAPELISVELRTALDAVGEVIGIVDVDNILGRIFESFCIGK